MIYLPAGEWLLEVTKDLLRPDLDDNSSSTQDLDLFEEPTFPRVLSFEQRFRYFQRFVCKVRLWSDCRHILFERLKAAAAEYMESMAVLCHARFEELKQEPDGIALVTFASFPEESEFGDRVLRQDDDKVSC